MSLLKTLPKTLTSTVVIVIALSVLSCRQEKNCCMCAKKCSICSIRPRGYKTFFMLNSAEHENFHGKNSQITNNAKFFLAKHS